MTSTSLTAPAMSMVKHADLFFANGQMHVTSVSASLGLVEFALRMFKKVKTRLVAWVRRQVQSVVASRVAADG